MHLPEIDAAIQSEAKEQLFFHCFRSRHAMGFDLGRGDKIAFEVISGGEAHGRYRIGVS